MTYNYQVHLDVERWKLSKPRNRYAIRKMRRLRKLRKSGIPIDLPLTGGQSVTGMRNGKPIAIATGLGTQEPLTNWID